MTQLWVNYRVSMLYMEHYCIINWNNWSWFAGLLSVGLQRCPHLRRCHVSLWNELLAAIGDWYLLILVLTFVWSITTSNLLMLAECCWYFWIQIDVWWCSVWNILENRFRPGSNHSKNKTSAVPLNMKPSLVEEEDDDMPDSGSMKSVSQTHSCHSRLRSRTQQSQPSDGAGSRAACDAIQGVAPATTEREVEVQVEDSSDMDDEVLKEKSMHLPMRCNYWEATDRLPTLAPKKTQATQSSWGSEDVGEEKRVTFADVGAPQGKKAATAAVNAINLPTQKNHTHSSYASLPQAQSVGLSAEGNEFEIWDETWGVAGVASRSEGKHPTQSEHCNLELTSGKAKGTCGRITSLCARHCRKFCCCAVSLGSFACSFLFFLTSSFGWRWRAGCGTFSHEVKGVRLPKGFLDLEIVSVNEISW